MPSVLDLLGETDSNRSIRNLMGPEGSIRDLLEAEPVKLQPVTVDKGFVGDAVTDRLFKQMYGVDRSALEKMTEEPFISEEFKQDFVNTLGGLSEIKSRGLFGSTYEALRGAASFAASIPGFMLGIGLASREMLSRLGGGPATFEDLYEAASRGMESGSKFWEGKVVSPLLGEPSGMSQLVGATAMAPALALSAVAKEISEWPRFADDPNIRGLLRFAGDIGGLVALKRIYHGGGGKATEDVENFTRKAAEHKVKQDAVDQIPNEVLKSAQQKILDMEKNQLALEASNIMDKIDFSKMIKQQVEEKAVEIKEAKQLDAEAEQELVEGVFGEKVTAGKKRPVEKPKVKVPTEEELITGEEKVVDTSDMSEAEVKAFEALVGVEEPLTDLDLQTGTRVPPKLSTENSPFREDPKRTAQQRKLLAEKKIADSPEMLVSKALNEVNWWLDGNEVDIADTRNALSELAIAVSDPGNRLALLDYFNNDIQALNDFIEVTKEAASWARSVGRIASGEGTKLYSGVPIDEVVSRFADLWKKAANADKEDLVSIYRDAVGYLNRGDIRQLYPVMNRMRKAGLTEDAKVLRDSIRAISSAKAEDMKARIQSAAEKLYGGSVTLHDIGGATGEGAKKVLELFKSAVRKGEEARGIKTFKPKEAANALRKEFTKAFVERSGNIRRELLNALGDQGYSIIQKLYLSKGSSALAASRLKQMGSEVYRGLSGDKKNLLDDLIFHSRILDIAKYKTKKQFKELEKYTPAESIIFLEAFDKLLGISPEEARDLYHIREDGSIGGRTGAYFDWMRKALKDMYDAELISEQEYEDLSTHNYRRLKIVDVFDKKRPVPGKKGISVYDSGIESLARGRKTTVFERDSQVMALEVFNRIYGRILNNEANKNLLALAREKPDNPFTRLSKKDGGEGSIPSGWVRRFAYEGGERKAVFVSPDMAEEWIASGSEASYRLSQFLRWGSLAPVVRLFATGIDWGFAVANLPRDILHSWWAARIFEGNKWKFVYSPHLPIFGLEMGADLTRVFTDAALKKGRYQDYIDEGGGMEFLVHQGRLFRRGRHLGGPFDKILDVLGYFGETSEIMTRLAIRDRVIRKRAKQEGINYAEAAKNKKISQEATFAARDYMDFGQGGGIAKVLDNGFPYTNAAIQGTRGLVRAFKDDPLVSTYKLSQLASVTVGLYIAMKKLTPETEKELRGSMATQNNLCIPLGDQFGFMDEKGQMRYIYLKIPLDPGQKFFKKFFEAATDKWLGYPIDVDGTVNALEQISPVGISSLPPTMSAVIGYMANKDFWRNEDIWKQTKPFSYPKSAEEWTKDTPQVYIDIGKGTGLSPERTRYAVEELVTSGSMWSYLVGQGYETMFGDLPKEKKEQHLAMVLSQIPIAKRFIGVTNPYSKHASKVKEYEEDAVIHQFVQEREFDMWVDAYLYGEKGQVTRGELVKMAQGHAKFDKDEETYDRLMDRLRFEEAIVFLPEKSLWRRMKGLKTEAKAKIFADRLQSSNEKEKKQLWKEFRIISNAKGVISDNFMSEVEKILGER